ncbi:MipA/OmpV family protein [uncultured Ruegeria sp.]|uniref:MipA/OmpV family protein n=1 Tax=uncultured Ruegeria sp. TaxID=259304 RepID=UPI0026359F6F|nr:MipA/OmpV family protein [uncultured Ruegeria sp.]
MKSKSLNHSALAVVGTCLAVFAGQAAAQSAGNGASGTGGWNDWDFYLGAGVAYAPEYEGSDKQETSAFPAFEAVWRDTLVVSGKGIGAFVYDRNGLRVSAALGYGGGREESDSVHLRGLGDIDDGAVVSLGAQLDLAPRVTATADVNTFLKGSKGTVVSLGLQSQVPFGVVRGALSPTGNRYDDVAGQQGLALIGGVSIDWANDNYNQSFFGVSAAQSSSSGLRQYSAGSGLKSVNAEIGFSQTLGDNWGLTGIVQYSRLLGDAKDSPVVKSEGNYAAVLAIGYRF